MVLTRRSRIALAAVGLAIAGLAAVLGPERRGGAPATASARVVRGAGSSGDLRIEEHPADGWTLPWPAVGAFGAGVALLAFAAWPRRPRNPPPPA